ncbi:helix-turn-helix domain-containing protein [Agromyces sp. NPDC056965]|uniref:helix-turn-helix domain-containing protein n=1 Tax=Agromyces sp. NPDC056965 TaxID=3345983 RepID=UPI0036434303
MSDERALTVKELAEHFGVHPSTIYVKANGGDIPAFRIGRSWRFYLSEVKAHLDRPVDPWALPSQSRQSLGRKRKP